MPRGMQDAHPDVAEIELIPISKRTEVKMCLRRLVEVDRRPGLGRQFAAAGEMVGLDVGFDDVRDPDARLLGRLEVLIDILLWIHHSCAVFTPSPKEVRGTPGLWPEKLPENHLSPLLSSSLPTSTVPTILPECRRPTKPFDLPQGGEHVEPPTEQAKL